MGSQWSTAELSIQQKTGLSPQAKPQLFEIHTNKVIGALGKKNRSSGGFDAGSWIQMLGELINAAYKSTALDLSDILEMFSDSGKKAQENKMAEDL